MAADRLETRQGYKPDHKSFGAFMMSGQARDPAIAAARDIANIARRTAPRSRVTDQHGHAADGYRVDRASPPVIIGGNPRVGARVYNSHIRARRIEFQPPRPGQPPRRPLGRAGAAVGDLSGGLG